MKTVCAIMSTFNEVDIVLEAVEKLIANGVAVFLIDNGSTDGTTDRVAHLVGQGIIDIKSVKYLENGREVYNWTALLQLKEQLSRELNFDWYIHVDADEIRYAPWPGLSLREGIDKVDHSGYNLINFKLFNFRLIQNLAGSDDYERDMPYYSGGERFNQRQLKAWKAHREIDLASYGGHIAQRPGGKIYPVRFIHKHYPVRSLEHGQRKIMLERKNRFSMEEKRRGWHVQYDQLTDISPNDVFWPSHKLTEFRMAAEQASLISEACDVVCRILATSDFDSLAANLYKYLHQTFINSKYETTHANQVLEVSYQLANLLSKGSTPTISTNRAEADLIGSAVKAIAAMQYLNGDASAFPDAEFLKFQVEQ